MYVRVWKPSADRSCNGFSDPDFIARGSAIAGMIDELNE